MPIERQSPSISLFPKMRRSVPRVSDKQEKSKMLDKDDEEHKSSKSNSEDIKGAEVASKASSNAQEKPGFVRGTIPKLVAYGSDEDDSA